MKLKAGIRTSGGPAAPVSRFRQRLPGWCGGLLMAGCVAILLAKGLPGVHRGPNVLRPVDSEAFSAFERMMEKMQPPETQGEWLPLVANGPEEGVVAQAMSAARTVLEPALKDGSVTSWYQPDRLWPDPAHQAANIPVLAAMAAGQARLEAAVMAAGFEAEAFQLARAVFARIQEWAATPEPAGFRWPDPLLLEGTLGNLMQRSAGQVSALGFVQLPPGRVPGDDPVVAALEEIPHLHPAGWRYLNHKILPLVREEAQRICIPAGIVLLVLLFIVFRGSREILLAVGTLAFSGLFLLAFMSWRDMEWNFVNIAAIPLSLGLGLDFTIHMIYALRRHDREGGDGTHGVGRALAYCGLSTGLGFGSLALSGNTGLISMGLCCMVGVLATLFSAAFLLPWAWRAWPRRRTQARPLHAP